MTKEIAARAAPTHQIIINVCKFDFAIYLATQIFVKPFQMSQNFTAFRTLIVFTEVEVIVLPKRERFHVITEEPSYQVLKHQILY
jgi:hypothetical protein